MRKIAIFLLFSAMIAPAAYGQGAGPLSDIARLSRAVSKRISSHDRSGGNADAVLVPAGQTVTLAEITGAGSIKHIWITVASESRYHLREVVLRMYWDGETEPSVQSPLGDFFGTGFGAYKSWQSIPLTVQDRALNCYFPMPFSRGARVTVSNDGEQPVNRIVFHIDYEQYPHASETENQGRFHAHWRRANPVTAIPTDSTAGVNTSRENNFTFLDAEGRGQFVGVVLHVQGFSTGWWGEGDDMFFIDGEPYPPSVHGTGLEDYFNNAWGFQEEFCYPFVGYSLKGNPDWTGSHTMYRFHIQDPIYFTRFLFGAAEAGATPSISRAFGDWIPVGERARAQGVFFSGMSAGSALTPPLVTLMLVQFGWRACFPVLGAVGLFWALGWHLWYRDSVTRVSASKAAAAPVNWSVLLRSSNLWAILLMYFTYGYTGYIFITWFPAYLIEARHIPLYMAGLLAAVPSFLGMFAKPLGGWWSDWLTRRRGVTYGRRLVGMVGFGLGAAAFLPGVLAKNVLLAVLLLAIADAGAALAHGVCFAVCLDVGLPRAGTVSALMLTMGSLGNALSALAFGWFLQTTGSWIPPFVIAAVANLAGALLWLKIDPRKAVV